MKYIDLSHEIKNNMPVYPGDIDVNLTKEKDESSYCWRKRSRGTGIPARAR